ncbi:IucA/IucC family protein [Streptomyces sp. SP18CS02]|uniref:IucA/IucC family protein n=1 Tax=Streptomyces sp. SP18CS02 TaxID=3002531 RepID=UPI002E79F14F|nr:IucA/IucC family siderophore biosynthesis protein [Streptomyces sp. SP18CS02]MEE1756649.1 IucA/IucC family siderophore biosynthesis protein [Streptomyces sp. SP18CS02]
MKRRKDEQRKHSEQPRKRREEKSVTDKKGTARMTAGHPVPELADVSPESWREANRRLLAKTLSEFAFEELIKPVPLEGDRYRVDLDSGVSYVFSASQGALGSWRADKDSVTRGAAGLLGNEIETPAWDAQQFLVDCAGTIGTDAPTLGMYLTEVSATLAVDAARIEHGGENAAELRELGHAELECRMTGHPTLVANKGRIGFSATDVRAYAPESQELVRLQWIAVHRGLAEFRGTPDLSERAVLAHELSEETIAAFRSRIERTGGDPDAYVWMPVHPWQWDHAVQVLFAGEVAQRRVIPLGESADAYLPQQSVRTMTNMSERERFDVKLPLKIVNTLIWRGIPPHCTQGAPVATQWLTGLLDKDPVLRDELRTVFLGEIASVTVRHPYLDRVPEMPYQHLETLGCIWRESVSSRQDEGERVRTFASLLYVDEQGTSFAAELARASGLPAEEWLTRLFETVLHPVLHVMYTYGITFNPHGQNTLIGYDGDDVPRRLFLKDFVDDVSVSHTPVPERGPEPDGYDHVLPRKNPVVIRQHVVDQLLLGHFRYLAPLVAEQLGVPEERFWRLVRGAVDAYHGRFPEKADRFAEFDMLADEFPRYPFNTDRLVITRYVDRALRHALRPNGTVANPLS